MNIVLTLVLIGNLTPTAYRSVPEQTDSSPFITATGERVHNRGVAVSRDLLKRWGGKLEYGDLLYIEGVGYKFVFDTMHERHKNRFDVWVPTLQAEKEFDRKFRGKKLKVYLVRRTK